MQAVIKVVKDKAHRDVNVCVPKAFRKCGSVVMAMRSVTSLTPFSNVQFFIELDSGLANVFLRRHRFGCFWVVVLIRVFHSNHVFGRRGLVAARNAVYQATLMATFLGELFIFPAGT